ncbi:MAG: redoxin domain-containing protein [Chitinophagaceae bacterium]
MPITVGQSAPLFTLWSSDKKEISLADYKGRNVLLLFYPMAYTSVCTAELCNIRDNIGRYSNVNAEVFGISVDSVYTLAKFKEEQGYNFTLLADFNKDVTNTYGVLQENFAFGMKGVSKRASFVIDKEGMVAYAEVTPTLGDMPNFEAINDALEKLG